MPYWTLHLALCQCWTIIVLQWSYPIHLYRCLIGWYVSGCIWLVVLLLCTFLIIFCFRPTIFTVNVVCNVFHDDPNEGHKLKLCNIEHVLLGFSQCTNMWHARVSIFCVSSCKFIFLMLNNRHNMKPDIVLANRFLYVLPNWQLREKASSAKSHSPK